MSEPTQLRKGQWVLMTSGEYSSYGVLALYEVLEDMPVPQKPPLYAGRKPYVDWPAFRSDPRVREISYVEFWAGE